MHEQEALVSAILRSPRIRDRLVVLCEGDLLALDDGGAPSPQMYGRLEHMPDANFHKSCISKDWHGYRLPQFFNCGGRSQVLYVYARLLERHQLHPEASYLTPEKLYALVDLDIQRCWLPEGYPWQTTEDVHAALYQDGAIRSCPADEHRLWVTALVHKEAFFVSTPMAAAWADGTTPFFRGAPLDLQAFHDAVAQRCANDADLAGNLMLVTDRLGRFAAGAAMSGTDGSSICAAWRAAAAQASPERYEALLRALLSVAKVKPVWSEIEPDPQWQGTMPAENFRDQLALKVAGVIARTPPEEHPLSGFFAWLKSRR